MVVRATPAVVGLALLLVLAGCGATGLDRGGTPRERLTPVSVPDGDRPSVAPTVAPGVSDAGVYDAFALANAHQNALRNRSYVRMTSTTLADGNGTLRDSSRRLRVTAQGVPYRLSVSSVSADRYPVSAVFPDLGLYYDGDTAFYRVQRDGNVSYRRDTTVPITGPITDRTGRDRLIGLVTAFEWRVERVEIGLATRYRLRSTNLTARSSLSMPTLLSNPRDAEMRVLLGPDGRVYRYRLTYLADYRNGTASVTRSARWLDAGETTVSEPAWLDRARNASAAADPSGNRLG